LLFGVLASSRYALACRRTANVDGVFSFVAPPAGQDVILNVRNTDTDPRNTAVQLQSTCGGTAVGPSVGPDGRFSPSPL
jgi:hypothetical protein